MPYKSQSLKQKILNLNWMNFVDFPEIWVHTVEEFLAWLKNIIGEHEPYWSAKDFYTNKQPEVCLF